MPHVVKKGETLSKIARAHGITLAALLDVNPQFALHPDIIHPGDVLILPEDVQAPPVQPLGVPTVFARRVAAVAVDQFATFEHVNEADPQLCGQIKNWTEDIGSAFVSCTSNDHPWSAVFVSWCVKQAGATRLEFKFSTQHSVFVHSAIKNATDGRGVFHGMEITAHRPNVGDIIQMNRGDNTFTFDFARTHSDYKSHSVIVAGIRNDSEGAFAFCIGGNEGDEIRQSQVRLTPQGFILQRGRNPYICVIKNLK